MSPFSHEKMKLRNFIRMCKIPGWAAKLGWDPGMWTPESVSGTMQSGCKNFGVKPIARASGLLRDAHGYLTVFTNKQDFYFPEPYHIQHQGMFRRLLSANSSRDCICLISWSLSSQVKLMEPQSLPCPLLVSLKLIFKTELELSS